MKRIQRFAFMVAAALTLTLGGQAVAQPQGGFGGGPSGGGGPGGGGMNFQNMTPEEMQKMLQQRILDSYREQMDVTNDADWKLIADRIAAVTEARTATMADGGGIGGMMGFGGMRGGRGGGGGGGGGGRGGGFQALFGQPSPESEALQKAIDANAPAAQLKTLLAKLQAVHKEKLAKLDQAQDDLRAVLTTRQECIAVMGGLLN
ncbi:MAG TPA: hypothetical protein VIK53_14210 [Verrucomicrobiae bacterium]